MSKAQKRARAKLDRLKFETEQSGQLSSNDSDDDQDEDCGDDNLSPPVKSNNLFAALMDSEDDSESDGHEQLSPSHNTKVTEPVLVHEAPKLWPKVKAKGSSKKRLDSSRKDEGVQAFDDNTESLPRDADACLKNIWLIDRRLCNPQIEIRRLYGEGALDRGRRKGLPVQKMLTRYKHFSFGTRLDTWPLPQKLGIDMQPLQAPFEFGLVFSSRYQQVQHAFCHFVARMNPQGVQSILHEMPYHLDSLVMMAGVAQSSGDHSLAHDLLGRALYAFEQTLHPSYKLFAGDCRLPYSTIENRVVHLAFFFYAKSLGQRGCWRTALECAKVLYFLDVEYDPLFTLDSLVYYGLQSKEYVWTLELCTTSLPPEAHLWYPSCHFGAALALFHLGRADEARAKLTECFALYNYWIPDLLEATGLRSSSEAERVLQDDKNLIFGPKQDLNDERGGDPSSKYYTVDLLVKFYIEQNNSLWKVSAVSSWLLKSLIAVSGTSSKEYSLAKERLFHRFDKLPCSFDGALPLNLYRKMLLLQSKKAKFGIFRDSNLLTFDPFPDPQHHDSDSQYVSILDQLFHRNNSNIFSSNFLNTSSIFEALRSIIAPPLVESTQSEVANQGLDDLSESEDSSTDGQVSEEFYDTFEETSSES